MNIDFKSLSDEELSSLIQSAYVESDRRYRCAQIPKQIVDLTTQALSAGVSDEAIMTAVTKASEDHKNRDANNVNSVDDFDVDSDVDVDSIGDPNE